MKPTASSTAPARTGPSGAMKLTAAIALMVAGLVGGGFAVASAASGPAGSGRPTASAGHRGSSSGTGSAPVTPATTRAAISPA
jgi:hypothetical protein